MDRRNPHRLQTNSVTHLVKIIAEEVVRDMLGSDDLMSQDDVLKLLESTHVPTIGKARALIDEALKPLRLAEQALVARVECLEHMLRNAAEPEVDIDDRPASWEQEKAGASWSLQEDCDLRSHFDKAVSWMASKHGRSARAIRLHLREMIKKNNLNLS